MEHDLQALRELQALPMERKVLVTQTRLFEWYNHWDGQIHISFSGGIDSTVLMDIAKKLFPSIKAMYVDTGLEYPEIRAFVKTFDNVDIVRPKMAFNEVVKKYGYPAIGKEVANKVYYARKGSQWAVNRLNGLDKDGNATEYSKNHYSQWKWLVNADFNISDQCCAVMKKSPAHLYAKQNNSKAVVATMTEESSMRQMHWLKEGCNAFDNKHPTSKPMSFWTRQDVLKYIYDNKLPIASVYGDVIYDETTGKYETTGVDRTGCIFCCFGVTHDKEPTRFQRLKETHPKQYNYCINGGGLQGRNLATK